MYKLADTTDVPVELKNAIETLINYKDPDYNGAVVESIIFEKSAKDNIRRLVIKYKTGDWWALPIHEY